MSEKSKIKQKRKRGASQGRLDFISPMSPEECIEHLKAGRSPFSRLSLDVDGDGDQFTVHPHDRYYQKSSLPGGRGTPTTFGPSFQSPASFWFDGHLEPHPAGTHVQGQMRWEDYEYKLLFLLLGLVCLGTAVLSAVFALVEHALADDIFICGLLPSLLIFLILFLIRDEVRQRKQALLLQWIDERLNVRRDKR
jgi:hypothetical protein